MVDGVRRATVSKQQHPSQHLIELMTQEKARLFNSHVWTYLVPNLKKTENALLNKE